MRGTGSSVRLLPLLLLPAVITLAPAPPAAAVPAEPHGGGLPGAAEPTVGELLARLPLTFVEVGGSSFPYRATAGAVDVGFAPGGVHLALGDPGGTTQRWGLELALPGARPVEPEGVVVADAVVSYFRGEPAEWRTGLSTYERVAYRGLWPGVDAIFSAETGGLKYSFRLTPGADPEVVRLDWRGAVVTRTEEGGLRIATPAGALVDGAPTAWQPGPRGRTPVGASWEHRGDGTWGFRVGSHDPGRPLVIDPEVLFTRFVGGSGYERGEDIAVDGSGAMYVTGWTFNSGGVSDFPASVGPDTSFNGGIDVFVAKLTPGGEGIAYAGFIGGSDYEDAGGIAVDGLGAAYVVGRTSSDSAGEAFPVMGALDPTFNGSSDAFVAKVNPDGTGLTYAGYIGGSMSDSAAGVAVDGSGAAYVSGQTSSDQATFPDGNGFGAVPGPDVVYNLGGDAWVAKVNANGTGLDYAGYIGGSNYDTGTDVAVDGAGAAYVVGGTLSDQMTFPDLVGPDGSYGGGWDGFVAKVKASGSGLDYAGYIGGSGFDAAAAVAVDGAGAAYVVGDTQSDSTAEGFPAAVGPDTTYAGSVGEPYSPQDGFVGKVDPAGSGFTYLGYIGGNDHEAANAVAVDATGAAHVAGETGSTEAEDAFPAAGGPDGSFNGGTDAFVGRVLPSGSGFGHLGYVGGLKLDFAFGIDVDAAGVAYVVGQTNSNRGTFPVLGPPPSTTADAFVVALAEVCGGKVATIIGTQSKDKVTGTSGADVIASLGGRDTVNGKGGADRICGGGGNDKLKGGGGKDKLYGEEGKDTLVGQAGSDTCVGGPLKDRAKDCEKERQI